MSFPFGQPMRHSVIGLSDSGIVPLNAYHYLGRLTGSRKRASLPLRTVVTQNRVLSSSEAQNKTHSINRWPFQIAADTPDLIFSFNNWISNGGDANTGNPISIVDFSVESDSSHTVVPGYFSGQRGITLENGAADVQSDSIPASAFGLTKFSRGEVYWFKAKMQKVATDKFPNRVSELTTVSGVQVEFYNAADTVISSTDVAGKYTKTSGTATLARFLGYMPLVLGHPAANTPSFFFQGDSIAEGFGDGGKSTIWPSGVGGVGMFQRAMNDPDLVSTPLPSINFGRGGNQSYHVLGVNTKSGGLFYKYARFLVEQYGINDINQNHTSGLQDNLLDIWEAARAAGIEKVIRTELLPRTSSTDDWLTAANQSIYNQRQTDDINATNAWLADKLADGTLDGVVSMATLRDPEDGDIWVTDGVTANYAAYDGLHPSHNGAIIAANAIRSKLQLMGLTY